MNKNLLIIGASGHGKVLADLSLKMNRWENVAFLDDDADIHSPLGLDVIDQSTEAYKYVDDHDIFVGIGNNIVRKKIQKRLEEEGAHIPTLVHPRAIIGEGVTLGTGTAVMAGVVINCCTTIGNGCIINTGVTIDHDNTIGDYVHISPGAHLAGTVQVGQESWLGIGSVVSHNITITSGCMIGAGAVVAKDIIKTGTYVGVPARLID